jgi:exosortase/archaeosortase family protein
MLESELKHFKSYLKKSGKEIRKSPTKQFTFFILGFVLSYLFLSGIVGLFPQIIFKAATGIPTETLLNIQGIETSHEYLENYTIYINETTILISWLCAGTMEIIVLISAIIAGFGVSWEKKLKGIVAGIITGYVFNILRVWITINVILTQSIEVADFTHDVLFRIILFVYITGFYVAWFYWSENGFPKKLLKLKGKILR